MQRVGNNQLNCGGTILDLSRPQVMGILNVTPNSFVDGGRYLKLDQALQHTADMVSAGATVIDVGGEATNPGAVPVSPEEEMDRVIPVIEALHREFPVVLSVDTSQPHVMAAAISAGVGLINDIRALRVPGAMEAVAKSNAAVCLMHMQGEPATMQKNPQYDNVVTEVKAFLADRVKACIAAGIPASHIIVDPGFGFGKTLTHNSQLLNGLADIVGLNHPVLVGLSRKSMIEKALGLPVERRLSASLALAVLAVQQGAVIVRAHDVGPTLEAISMAGIVLAEQGGG